MELTYLKEIETLYKCCKPNAYGKEAVNEVIKHLSEEEKIIIAKFTKYVPSIKQWCIDWSGMGLAVVKKDVWKYLARTVDNATGTKAVRGTSIPKFLIDLLDEVTSEDLDYVDKDPVLDIYNATGKIIHHYNIKKTKKKSDLSLYSWVVKLCKENNIKRVEAKDLEKIISYLEKLCPVSYNKKLFGELPEHLEESRKELFEYFQQRTAISRNQLFKNPNLFHKLVLAGYRPAELKVNFSEQGDISSYTYKRYLEYEGCFNQFNKLSKDDIVVGLGHYQAKIQQPFCAEESILYLEESDVKNILLLNIKNNLEIIKKYMDEPKPYYLTKNNKRFSFNFNAIALDIYYNEKVLVNPIAIAHLKKEDIFNGKEPVEVATILSQEEV